MSSRREQIIMQQLRNIKHIYRQRIQRQQSFTKRQQAETQFTFFFCLSAFVYLKISVKSQRCCAFLRIQISFYPRASNLTVETFPGQPHDRTPHSADGLQQPGRRSNRRNIFRFAFDGLFWHRCGNEVFTAQFPPQFLSN